METPDCGSILVVDDDAAFRSLVVDLLGSAGFSTVEAASGEDALARARECVVEAALVDVVLPGISGYEVCRALKEEREIPVVLMSGEQTEPVNRVAGLLIGADDYVLKPFAPDELLARIRRLVRTPVAPAAESNLSKRELEVLQLLADGLDQDEIAERLVLSPKTVSSHIQRVLGKLDVHSRAQAIAQAYRRGILSVGGRAVSR
jgi:two-component system, OmpR family, alkaline phosphatase synthesis response regulator PhoP